MLPKAHFCTIFFFWSLLMSICTYLLLLLYTLFLSDGSYRVARDEDSDYQDEDFVVSLRVNPSRRGKAPAADQGGSRITNRRKSSAKRKKVTDPSSDEEVVAESVPDVVPASNMKTCAIKIWTSLRQLDPYRFPLPTFTHDPRFWTRTQYVMWTQFYQDIKMTKFVKPLRPNLAHIKLYKDSDFKFVYAALLKMNLMPLLSINQDYVPELVNQLDRKSVV